ncbi:MAG: hypothetical protein CMD28_02220 [Flavobacteriales bacterium]|nr:hypothetical protein [Flavobacteriales bacterium]
MTTWNRDDSDLTTVLGLNSTTVGNIRITGNTIGHSSDTDILTFAENTLDITALNVDINGSLDIKNSAGNTTYVSLSSSGISGTLITAAQPNITTVGTIGTGVWNATALTAAKVPDHDDLNGFVVNEHLDWTNNQGSADIHQSNIPWANGQSFDNDNAGIVPNPGSTGTTTKYLREDGNFQIPPDTNTQLSTEEVQDIVGNMFSLNTEVRISATYVDGGVGAGKINLEVDDLNTDTTYTGGTNLTLDGTTFNVADAFLINSGDDSTSGVITAGGFTTTGTWTFDTSAGGTTGITNVNVGSAFTDSDTTIMSAGAIKEKIESYNYSATTGTITSVEVTTDTGSGGRYNQSSSAASISILGTSGIGVTNSSGTITVTSVPSEIDHNSLDNYTSTEHFTQANIVTVGSITTGEWTATPIAHAYIGNDAIEGDNLADNAVNSEHYTDGSIDTDHIADDQVTYAKIQNVSATDRILGRDSSGAGIIEEITPANLKTMLSLNNVENTALSTFAGTSNITTLASNLSLGGNPTTTTQSAGNSSTKIATTEFVSTAVSNLVDSSPDALNTLNELAAALGDDADFSTTVTNSIATKAPLASPTFTGTVTMPATIASAGDLTLDVVGDITLDADGGDITIVDNSPSSFKPSFQITSTDAGSFGPIVTYKHNSASPVNTDQIFTKSIIGKNDAGQDVTYINDSVVLSDVADGEERAYCQKSLMTHGTLRNALKFAAQSDSTVDTDIGYGAASSTTIAGDLTITGGNITNAITFDSGITNAGTIAAGTWQGTAINQTYLVGQSGTNSGDQTKASFDLDHLYTLVGAASDDAEHLGTFTGSTIADSQTIKQSLQALETAVESAGGASALNDLSDVTYSSGDLTITSLDKFIFGGAVDYDLSGDVTFTENGAAFSFLTLDYNQEIIKLTGNSGNTHLTTQIFGAQATVTCDDTLEIKANDMHFSNSSLGTFGWGLNSGTYSEYVSWNITSNTYKYANTSDSGDYYQMTVGSNGETTLATVDDDGATAHLNIEPDGHVEFDGCGVGFDLVTPTFNAADTNVDFRTGNKQMVTLTDNIADLNLTFPNTSGNFTLLLKQDGTGSRTIASDGYLVFEHDGTAATVSTVKFAGGSNPTLTTDVNHVDIVSFFWDADNQVCYGVASLDFQD